MLFMDTISSQGVPVVVADIELAYHHDYAER